MAFDFGGDAPRLATWPGAPEVPVLEETVLVRDMLKTWVTERGMSVTTWLHTTEHRASAPWTAVWTLGWCAQLLWLHFYDGPTTPGGLEEAHHHVVSQVRAGTLPGLARPEPEGVPGG